MIHTLLVDDDALTLELHRDYIARIDGYEVVGECSSARAALNALIESPPRDGIDLLLLDMTMPDGSGLDVLRHLRARSIAVDVIAITAVRDADTVRQMAALGVVQYLVKPFTFATFRERLDQHRAYRAQAVAAAGQASQAEIDALLGASRPTGSIKVPKGLSAASLARVTSAAHDAGVLSASEAAELLGMSRVAARRYLEHLADVGRLERAARYRGRGRPETEYRWR
ncbi:response regulator [Microbacterium sp. AK031]|uniref:response regulator n=1 Tax=Microbacterium sp. AK031 TaxID=2723076 RepID=UPI002167A835|nr:response regulator [Microbacterium sp. AK031]MCS3842287.1 response regulator of citrate/malate metabolism [Microbacterium sp. AK031]